MPDCNRNMKRVIKAYRDVGSSHIEFIRAFNKSGKPYIEIVFTNIEFYVTMVKLGFTGSLNVEVLSSSESLILDNVESKVGIIETNLESWCEKPLLNSTAARLSPDEKQSPLLANHVEQYLQRLRHYSLDESKTQIACQILQEFQTALSHIQKYFEEELIRETARRQFAKRF